MRSAAPASLRLASAWTALAAAPIALGGLWPERTWPLHAALTGILLVAVTVLPTLWASAAPAGPRDDLWRERLGQLLLLACVSAPFLALAGPFSPFALPSAVTGIAYAGALWLVLALGLARARSPRAWIGFSAAWGLGAPLLVVLLSDLRGGGLVGAAVAPPLALLSLLEGHEATAAFAALGLLLVLVAVGGGRRVRLAAGALLLAALVPGASPAQADPRVREARALLGSYVRPGEPYPVSVQADGLSAGDLLAAQSFRHRWEVPAVAGAVHLGVRPLGSGRRVELMARAKGSWSRLDAGLEEPRVVSEQTLLVGTLGPRAGEIARRLFAGRRALRVPLALQDMPLLGLAGEALDVVVVEQGWVRPEAMAHLRAWSAAGGALVLSSEADVERLSAGAARGGTGVRALGAGILVGLSEGVLPGAAPPERLEERLRGRARRRALEEVALDEPRPAPSRALQRRAGAAALGIACAIMILLVGVGRRTPRATLLGGAALAGLLLTGIVRAAVAPAGVVYARSSEVLEMPAGASVARRLQLLRFAAVRPTRAELSLSGRAVPQAVFDSSRDAARREGRIRLRGAGAGLELPLLRETRTFVRLDAVDLGGAVHLTRGSGGQAVRVVNGTRLELSEVYAVVAGGLYPVADLPAGSEVEIDLLARLPFAQWRTAQGDDARDWRELVTAALSGRDLARSLILFAKAPCSAQTNGAAEEHVAGALVVVVASAEAH